MRKFAANYLLSESGILLKNGILVAEEDGTALELLDTKGGLQEMARLVFHNGILLAGFKFVKARTEIPVSEADHPIRSFIFESVKYLDQLSIHNLIDLGKKVQVQFPEMKISEILNEISEVLLTSGGFKKEVSPGIFLLTGVALSDLHFTSNTRLKKIL